MNISITRKEKKYNHLSDLDRRYIADLCDQKYSKRAIAKKLHRSPSTIVRELQRNGSVRSYDENNAHYKAQKRWIDTHKKQHLSCDFIRFYIDTHIKQYWSPEQIANRLTIEYPQYRTNYESIYQYIYKERVDLCAYLRSKHRKRRKRGLKYASRRSKIPYRTPIEQRGDISNELGHWEADLVGASSKSTVLALVEKRTRFCIFHKIPDKKANTMKYGLLFSLRNIPKSMIKSITFDNGSENVLHYEVTQQLQCNSFFCNPYHSWEKGLVDTSNASTSTPLK